MMLLGLYRANCCLHIVIQNYRSRGTFTKFTGKADAPIFGTIQINESSLWRIGQQFKSSDRLPLECTGDMYRVLVLHGKHRDIALFVLNTGLLLLCKHRDLRTT